MKYSTDHLTHEIGHAAGFFLAEGVQFVTIQPGDDDPDILVCSGVRTVSGEPEFIDGGVEVIVAGTAFTTALDRRVGDLGDSFRLLAAVQSQNVAASNVVGIGRQDLADLEEINADPVEMAQFGLFYCALALAHRDEIRALATKLSDDLVFNGVANIAPQDLSFLTNSPASGLALMLRKAPHIVHSDESRDRIVAQLRSYEVLPAA